MPSISNTTESGQSSRVRLGEAGRWRGYQSPFLIPCPRSRTWDVYRVNDPTAIITFDGVAPESQKIGNQEFSATGTVTGGEIRVRRNWFPRWTASVNGTGVPITQTADGYMTIAAPCKPVK